MSESERGVSHFREIPTKQYYYIVLMSIIVTGPAKIGHVGSQNLTIFKLLLLVTFYSNMAWPHNFQRLCII